MAVLEAANSALQSIVKQQALNYVAQHGADAAETAHLKVDLRRDAAYDVT
jgi:hypothetical protein